MKTKPTQEIKTFPTKRAIDSRRTWALEDHLCRSCGGRILRCVTGGGMTGGGNPVYKCADCGKSGASMTPRNH